MATKASAGKGLKLQINTGTESSPTWITVGEALGVDLDPTMETEDATSFDSLGREFIATMLDGGEVPFTANRVSSNAGQIALAAYAPLGATAGQLAPLQVVAPLEPGQTSVGDTWSFAAIVSKFTAAFKPDKKTVMTGKLRTSNGMTFVEGS